VDSRVSQIETDILEATQAGLGAHWSTLTVDQQNLFRKVRAAQGLPLLSLLSSLTVHTLISSLTTPTIS
jgi:hypothetical protein